MPWQTRQKLPVESPLGLLMVRRNIRLKYLLSFADEVHHLEVADKVHYFEGAHEVQRDVHTQTDVVYQYQ